MTVKVLAPAKINLTLHVTGRRDDGYHLLDSLVVFADVGDHLSITPALQTSLKVTGPLSEGVPADESNLVLRAAGLIGAHADITLEKHLPNAAGIGGGSSDAGVVLRVLGELSNAPVPERGLSLGADVPVCLHGQAARMQGIGETITPLSGLPELHAVLLNPMVAVPTGPVFKNLNSPDNAPMPDEVPTNLDIRRFAEWLRQMRNDLEAPAIAVEPAINVALDALRATDCLLARMSGSGATCFALYEKADKAEKAAQALSQTHPDWWIRLTLLS